MTPERFRRVSELFQQCCELDARAQSEMLDRACADDHLLRKEVEALLASDRGATVTQPMPRGAAGLELLREWSAQAEAIVQWIGQYRVVRRIGEGGMGVVFEAEQDKPRRTVALKVIRAGLATQDSLKRFEQEAHVLGRLQHPGIAQIFEAGIHVLDTGTGRVSQPFLAMELIRGRPLTRYADEQTLDARKRLELLARIAEAVQHAHSKGVIHRDLKPGNILVTDDGQPKILDFGIARATDSDLQVTTVHTNVGAIMGTLPYMSPEQVAGDPQELDTRSDVYALGVILFELLAGRLPYEVRNRTTLEAARVIREEEPSRLSSVNRTFRGDIETIVGKALEKDKSRRYQTANALAADIRRYLGDEPIAARPPSTWYHLRKFARRNRILVGGVAATFVALVAGLAASLVLYSQAEAARRLAQSRQKETEQVAEFHASMLTGLNAEQMGRGLLEGITAEVRAAMEKREDAAEQIDPKVKELLEPLESVNFTNLAVKVLDENILAQAEKAVREKFVDQPAVRAALLDSVGDVLRELGLYERATAAKSEVLEFRRHYQGDDDLRMVKSLNDLGDVLRLSKKLAEAEPYQREAVERARRGLGHNHPETLIVLDNMAMLLQAQGKPAEAESYCRESVDVSGRVHGEDHITTLVALTTLGFVLRAQGKLDEAEPYHREVLDRKRRVLGERAVETIISIANLGGLLLERDKPGEAEPYFREAASLFGQVLGDDHPHTITCVSNDAWALQVQGKLAEAESHVRDAMQRAQRGMGADDIKTWAYAGQLGRVLTESGRLDEAEPLLRETLERRRNVLGESHAETARALTDWADLLNAQKKPAEAEQHAREAVATYDRVLAQADWKSGRARRILGAALVGSNRFDEAEVELLKVQQSFAQAPWVPPHERRACLEALVDLFERRHAAEPEKGFDAKAAERRVEVAKLVPAMQPEAGP